MITHLYPFPPWGWYGGTMRLRTALEASREASDTDVYWWDATDNTWRGGLRLSDVGGAPNSPAEGDGHVLLDSLKRRLFPSTLMGSGRTAIARAQKLVDGFQGQTVVLHTSYLAPLVPQVRAAGARVIVDVHDVVSESHASDADNAPVPLRSLRLGYARRVRKRELFYLGLADGLVVAGWQDQHFLAQHGLSASWAPVGVDAELCGAPEAPPIRIGFIGNFRHSPTTAAATELLASPVAGDPRFEIVLAGLHSDTWGRGTNATTLGSVARTTEFYERVHAVTVPTTNPCGFKVKLGEAALAGKAVLTTHEGAAGYPPELRRLFEVVPDRAGITAIAIASALERGEPAELRSHFHNVVGRAAAARRYLQVLAGAV